MYAKIVKLARHYKIPEIVNFNLMSLLNEILEFEKLRL